MLHTEPLQEVLADLKSIIISSYKAKYAERNNINEGTQLKVTARLKDDSTTLIYAIFVIKYFNNKIDLDLDLE